MMRYYVIAVFALLAGGFLIVAPQTIARINLSIMARWPAEKKSKIALTYWKSRAAIITLRGMGCGLVVWGLGVLATLNM
jgi:hypothetical protein